MRRRACHLEVLGDDPAERAETVAIVTDELDRMSRYVADLLVLAQAEQPDFFISEPIDLGELGVDLHQRARALGPRSWVPDAAPPVGNVTVVADRERLVQAVLNLATNALEPTDPGTEIGIGIALDGGTARLWVRDAGPGRRDVHDLDPPRRRRCSLPRTSGELGAANVVGGNKEDQCRRM